MPDKVSSLLSRFQGGNGNTNPSTGSAPGTGTEGVGGDVGDRSRGRNSFPAAAAASSLNVPPSADRGPTAASGFRSRPSSIKSRVSQTGAVRNVPPVSSYNNNTNNSSEDETSTGSQKNQMQGGSTTTMSNTVAPTPTSSSSAATTPATTTSPEKNMIVDTIETLGAARAAADPQLHAASQAAQKEGQTQLAKNYETSRLRARLEAIESIRNDMEAEDIPVPSVVVVGNQSAGKSSVLEAISGINFPRGENTCTQCASIVRLETIPDLEVPYAFVGTNANPENSVRVTDLSQIGWYIESLSNRLSGDAAPGTILADAIIYITVRSCEGPTLTLIDVPGLTFVHKTQKNIHDVTVSLIKHHIRSEQAVILAVLPATEDFGNCEALNLAAEVDPTGARTLGVVTKCDIVGNDSDIVHKLLCARDSDVKLKLGFIAVRCRSPKEIEKKVPLSQMASLEETLFNTHPAFVNPHSKEPLLPRESWGIGNLVSRICGIQELTVARWLPEAQAHMRQALQARKVELREWPVAFQDVHSKQEALLNVSHQFEKSFSSLADARTFRGAGDVRNIAGRIRGFFDKMRGSCRRGMPKFLTAKHQVEISRLLQETRLHGLPNFISQNVLNHMLVTYMVPVLHDHSTRLVKETSNYVLHICHDLITELCPNYPGLANAFKRVADDSVLEATTECQKHMDYLAKAEWSHVLVMDDDGYFRILEETVNTVSALQEMLDVMDREAVRNEREGRDQQGRDQQQVAAVEEGANGNGDETSSSTKEKRKRRREERAAAEAEAAVAAAAREARDKERRVKVQQGLYDNEDVLLQEIDADIQEDVDDILRKLPKGTGDSLRKYGITCTDLICLARGLPEALDLDFLPKNREKFPFEDPKSGPNLHDSTMEDSERRQSMSPLVQMNSVRETQMSLLAYSHGLQSRFIDMVCTLTHKFFISELQHVLHVRFSMLGHNQTELEHYLENDPHAVSNRARINASISRLENALKVLEQV